MSSTRKDTELTLYLPTEITRGGCIYEWQRPCIREYKARDEIQDYILQIQEEFALTFDEIALLIEEGIQRKHKKRYLRKLTKADCKEIAREFKNFPAFWSYFKMTLLDKPTNALHRTCSHFYKLKYSPKNNLPKNKPTSGPL